MKNAATAFLGFVVSTSTYKRKHHIRKFFFVNGLILISITPPDRNEIIR